MLAHTRVDAWNRLQLFSSDKRDALGFQGRRKTICSASITNILYLFWLGDLGEIRLLYQ